ncbi:hypothetical protein BKA67DRAFT_659571 [Truncatella angustata]|uniref:DUF7730 domain-containing protein n=1 Tax=Truncatella angustata TaxID=152316 RepID=A0A9P8UIM6_9PEZI|nr:uncharacterized protein BKA67DRAFT_659571 [Truncatella angustata]KAH6652915.1 hypothetical protein BKA67DRAFT_659571 [Truncatella angustata]
MAPLLALNDQSHRHAAVTASNARIRISIYEYALVEEQPLLPQQVAAKSNKFLCRRSLHGRALQDMTFKGKEVTRRVFWMSQITRTCRHFYFELENYPVFYRVNTFNFFEASMILRFLSAITPQRRSFIRSITFKPMDVPCWFRIWNGEPASHPAKAKLLRHVAVLLHQCGDLRDMQIFISARYPFDIGLMDIVKCCNHYLVSQDDALIWSLPTIRPMAVPDNAFGITLIDLTTAVDLTNVTANAPHFSSTELLNAAIKAEKAILALRERLSKDKAGGNGVQITSRQVDEAIHASEIDFPGEERIQQNRFNSTNGPVSKRTRQKCNGGLVNDLGVIERTKNRYNAEGLLTLNIFAITGLRWSGSNIECEVQGYSATTDPQNMNSSWEDIEAVLTFDGTLYLGFYYQKLSTMMSGADPVTRLKKIQSIPTPQHVSEAIDHILRGMWQEQRHIYRTWALRWAQIRSGYEDMIADLEKQVNLATEQAAEEANQKRKPSKALGKKAGGKATKRPN